jgi:aldehyde dehydrogenase (NAD+)
VWSFSPQPLAQAIEAKSAGNLKRTWVETRARDWSRPDDRAFIDAATEVKTVWIPYGEG